MINMSHEHKKTTLFYSITHTIHVWYIYLGLADFYGFHAGKNTSPMDPMGTACWMMGSASL